MYYNYLSSFSGFDASRAKVVSCSCRHAWRISQTMASAGDLVRHIGLPFQISPLWTGQPRTKDQRDLRNVRASWVQTRARAVAPGGLGRTHQEDPPDSQ